MINTRVCRNNSFAGQCLDLDPNLRWSPEDISDPLLTVLDVAQERGRVEIDREFTNRKKNSIISTELGHKQPGSVIKIVDGINAKQGLLREITYTIKRNDKSISVKTTLQVETNV